MSEARIDRISNENSTAGPIISGITTFSGQNYFVPPKGTTAERPSNCPAGSIRFNTDSAKLEYFDSLQWLEMEAFNNELGVSGALGNRGLWSGYQTGTPVNVIQYVTISTLGDSIDFGDSTLSSSYEKGGVASSTRGVWGGGFQSGGGGTNTIDYVTIASTGNAVDFGDLTQIRKGCGGCGSSTRGLFSGGSHLAPTSTNYNIIDYITIASTGNAVDFGDANNALEQGTAISSSTRGIIAGGIAPGTINVIDYVTIATTGNAQDFGDLSEAKRLLTAVGNSTRGVFGGGLTGVPVNTIEYITIASTGNAQDFGDLTAITRNNGGVSAPTRGLFAGGSTPSFTNVIQYISILTTGNAIDFGDLLAAAELNNSGCSNGHGGL